MTAVEVAVIEAASTSAAVLDGLEEDVELAVSGSTVATPASVVVALVEFAATVDVTEVDIAAADVTAGADVAEKAGGREEGESAGSMEGSSLENAK